MTRSQGTKILLLRTERFSDENALAALQQIYDIRELDDATQAWQAVLLDHLIRIVVIDIRDPVANAAELVQQIRGSRVERILALPIVALSNAELSLEHIARFGEIFPVSVSAPLTLADISDLLLRLQVLSELSVTREALQKSRQELQAVRSVDPETDLLLMPAFDSQLERLLAHARRSILDVAVISLILKFNWRTQPDKSSLDERLTAIGRSLSNGIRLEDLACRSDNTEFCIATPNSGTTDILRFATRLRKVVETVTGTGDLEIWAYVGVANLAENRQRDAAGLRYHAQRRARQAMDSDSRHIILGARNPTGSAPNPSGDPSVAMDLNTALAFIQANRPDVVIPALPALLAQLGPLFKLVREQQATSRGTETKPIVADNTSWPND